jgi:hypothetical protein
VACPWRCSVGIERPCPSRRWPALPVLAQVLDVAQVLDDGPERWRVPGAARRITAAVVELAQVPELGRALGALDDGQGLAQVLDEIEGIGPERCSAGIERPALSWRGRGARASLRPWRCSAGGAEPCALALLGGRSPRCSTWPRCST